MKTVSNTFSFLNLIQLSEDTHSDSLTWKAKFFALCSSPLLEIDYTVLLSKQAYQKLLIVFTIVLSALARDFFFTHTQNIFTIYDSMKAIQETHMHSSTRKLQTLFNQLLSTGSHGDE